MTIVLKSDVPILVHLPSGCCFQTCCPLATNHCKEEEPIFEEKEKGHKVAFKRFNLPSLQIY